MADSQTQGKAYDLLVVLDATASMGTFIHALNKSLPEIISLSALTGCFDRIGVVAYRDYCGGELTEWSGWCSPSGSVTGPDIVDQENVLKMAGGIRATHGGDWPEATKTGLALAYQKMRSDATTIVLFYTDAPPHFPATGGSNHTRERDTLDKKSYGGNGHLFADWVSAAKAFKSGPKKAVVFSVVSGGHISAWSPYLYLSAVTGGTFFTAQSITSDIISQLTLGVLLTWMGAGNEMGDDNTILGEFKLYQDTDDMEQAVDEKSKILRRYYTTGSTLNDRELTDGNIKSLRVALKDMPASIQARGPSARNFAKRYVDDKDYKKLAVEQLRRIIASNVSAISVNPIFGTLWRTVCNDRANEARDGLITMFGLEVDRISDAAQKTRMKTWLEESYNYAAEVQELIASVPEGERFPVVFLDPTEEFATVSAENEDSDDRALNEFTRAELLEIGRSCDYRILRRLGKVLTRLTYVEKKEDLPAHIKNADADDVPQIPMALADPKRKRKFWKILLHAVLPGTMITARPAAVLAALALRMGILPLRDVADQELLAFREKWNTIDIPETWNIGCLSLLLDADSDYEARVAKGTTVRATPNVGILKEEDRKLFKTLVDYKMLEMNLKTTLQAKISWKPEKTKVALGPVVICRQCQYPRSVTMMASNGVCGMCTIETKDCKCQACTPGEDHDDRLKKNVSKDHRETSMGYWVECNRISCRGQYVIYNPDALRVRAKCYYCRHEDGKSAAVGQAPVVECHKCLSRVIWPEEYRPKNLNLSTFECPACTTNVVTIITHDTSAHDLTEENGKDWLLRNEEKAIEAPFNGRSLFYTASHCDLAHLPEKVEILPNNETNLTIAGKLVRNSPEVKLALRRWVLSRRTEAGVCSLCFSNVRKDNLRRACGRAGCHQLICNGCTKDWYGLNAGGRIINVAALSCPFCRRRPAPKTIGAFGLAQMGNLRNAVEEAGSWIYAWCAKCGFAKQYVERACAAGAPPELSGWACDECKLPEGEVVKDKECPGCGVVTEKMGGCDHITCPCGTHWCYACGKDVGADKIYEHIGLEHGGLWDDDDEDYEYDEYD
ncbi:Fc.00g114880.m01.CDS01 [Cosmosporella sp. VM-42]